MSRPHPDPMVEAIRLALMAKLEQSFVVPSPVPLGGQPTVIGASDHELAEAIADAIRTHLDRPEPGPELGEGYEVATADQFAQRWNRTDPESRQAFVDGYRRMWDKVQRTAMELPVEFRLNAAWWLGAEFGWSKSGQGFNAEMEYGETFHSLHHKEVRSPYLMHGPKTGTTVPDN